MKAEDRPGLAWTRAQMARARGRALTVAAVGLVGTVVAIGAAWCAADVLAAARQQHMALMSLLGFIVAAVLQAGIAVVSEAVAFAAGAAGRRRLRGEALAALLGAGPAALAGTHSAELAGVVVDRVEAVDGLFGRWLPAIQLAIAGPAVVAAVGLWIDPWAGGILVASGLLVPSAMALAGIGAAAAARNQFAAMARLQVRFIDRVRGIATIVLAGRAEDEAAALAASADELRRRTMRILRVAFLSSAALDAALVIALVGIIIRFGAAMEREALFALLLVPVFFAPLRAFAAAYQERMHAIAAGDALARLPPPPPPAQALTVRTVAAHGVTIDFEHVGFTWDASRGPALEDITFRVPAGQTVVLAGPSGAGKSTLMDLLLGFIRPTAGRITFNGANMADLTPQALSRLIAWVGQRPVLFANSIAENIRFAKPEASDEEVEAAARAAHVDVFADALPDGMETFIGENGHGLSGGQAQRIAIARAFLKDAPILLLDEPTAHLDPVTEADVLDSLRRLAVGRTTLLASHSTAAHAFSARRVDLRAGRVAGVKGAA